MIFGCFGATLWLTLRNCDRVQIGLNPIAYLTRKTPWIQSNLPEASQSPFLSTSRNLWNSKSNKHSLDHFVYI